MVTTNFVGGPMAPNLRADALNAAFAQCIGYPVGAKPVLLYSRVTEHPSTAALRQVLVALGAAVDLTTGGQSYYVSPTGSDSANGSYNTPFLTLGAARTAMRGTTIKQALFNSGTYTPGTVNFDSGDSGLSFGAAPGATVTFTGSQFNLASVAGLKMNGITINNPSGNAFTLVGSSNNAFVSININTITGTGNSGFEVKDASNGNLFDRIHVNGCQGTETQAGGFYLHGAWNNIIQRSLIENLDGMGIGVVDFNSPPRSVDNFNNQILFNIVRNACRTATDSGAIYTLGRNQLDTGLVIRGNLVDGMGGNPVTQHHVGIYLDDLASGVLAERNIVRGAGTHAVQLHGGQNNTVRNNILDLTSYKSGILMLDTPDNIAHTITMANEIMTANVMYSGGAAGSFLPLESHNNAFTGNAAGDPRANTNLYYCSGFTGTVVLDNNPLFGNPGFTSPTGSDYSISNTAQVSRVGFVPIDQTLYGLTAP